MKPLIIKHSPGDQAGASGNLCPGQAGDTQGLAWVPKPESCSEIMSLKRVFFTRYPLGDSPPLSDHGPHFMLKLQLASFSSLWGFSYFYRSNLAFSIRLAALRTKMQIQALRWTQQLSSTNIWWDALEVEAGWNSVIFATWVTPLRPVTPSTATQVLRSPAWATEPYLTQRTCNLKENFSLCSQRSFFSTGPCEPRNTAISFILIVKHFS